MKNSKEAQLLLFLLCVVFTCCQCRGQRAIICSDLPTLTNGNVDYGGGGSTNNRPVDTVATYTCATGYTLNGGTTSTCESSGGWCGLAPTCQPNCPDLPPLINGVIMYSEGSTNDRPVISSAVHSCNTGYTLTGDTTRHCVSGGSWSGSAPTCQGPTEPPTTCPDLTVPTNGMISYNMGTASLRTVDTVATYTCDTGYTLNGGITRTCGSDGAWSGSTPVCHQITCSDVPSLPNGAISYNDGSTDIRPLNTIVTHRCNTGYTLNGDSVRLCQNDGTWNGSPPTCQVSCGPPPSITNGSPGQPTSTMIGGEATYTCDTGYLLIGSETITCLSTGNWSSSPSCQSPPPSYLSLSSTNYLPGVPEIPLSFVGEGSGLVCHTDFTGCCEGNTGDWYYPNGSVVMEDGALYVSRGQMSVSLMMSGTATAPGGLYCCVVPTSGGIHTACINMSVSTDESHLYQIGAVVGGVVGGVVALAVVAIVTGVVMVAYLVLRYKRGGKRRENDCSLRLTDQGQSAAATNETITYEEILTSRDVKGDYSLPSRP